MKLESQAVESNQVEELQDRVPDIEQLLAKPHTKAPVWSFFGFHPNPEDPDKIGNIDRPVCRRCREVVLVKHSFRLLPTYTVNSGC